MQKKMKDSIKFLNKSELVDIENQKTEFYQKILFQNMIFQKRTTQQLMVTD